MADDEMVIITNYMSLSMCIPHQPHTGLAICVCKRFYKSKNNVIAITTEFLNHGLWFIEADVLLHVQIRFWGAVAVAISYIVKTKGRSRSVQLILSKLWDNLIAIIKLLDMAQALSKANSKDMAIIITKQCYFAIVVSC